MAKSRHCGGGRIKIRSPMPPVDGQHNPMVFSGVCFRILDHRSFGGKGGCSGQLAAQKPSSSPDFKIPSDFQYISYFQYAADS